MPIVLLEAMALGVPVIALDQGPLTDLCAGVKVPTLELLAWRTEIEALLAEPRRAQIVAMRQRETLDARHCSSVVARAYEDLYLELAR